jgi:GNAT superfamily N-acetyltransferase
MTQFGFNQAAGSFARKPWLLLHPEVRNKYHFIFKNILRKVGLLKEHPMAVANPKPKNLPLTAGLVVIGVIPNLQQKGLGTLLQQEFERKANEMSAKRLSLSVRKQNQTAIKSYTKNGFIMCDENETSFIMTKDLI